jgi:hypothetical protein
MTVLLAVAALSVATIGGVAVGVAKAQTLVEGLAVSWAGSVPICEASFNSNALLSSTCG